MTWQPIYNEIYPFERDDDHWPITPPKADMDAWHRAHPHQCRDCGKTGSFTAGGSHDGNMFELCDGCASIAGCRDLDDGRHASHWGRVHTVAEHQDLEAAQARRRATYDRTHPADLQEALPL